MVWRCAYLEELVFVAKPHRHAVAPMFTRPSIDMGILQYVVAHSSFVSYEYHNVRKIAIFLLNIQTFSCFFPLSIADGTFYVLL